METTLRSFWQFMINTIFKTVHWDEERCSGCLTCYEVCPVGCCLPDPATKKIRVPDQDRCVVCGACVLQCPEGALALM
ncbi:MAG: hypothetical protein DRI52_07280 [Chloroflexi bacterium]|nr:4Fe-4S binding protein [Anaerolineae bacterium]RLC70330.1 MAG: hypothetical protein DRI52_07280 [Chloroflexota bacterium]